MQNIRGLLHNDFRVTTLKKCRNISSNHQTQGNSPPPRTPITQIQSHRNRISHREGSKRGDETIRTRSNPVKALYPFSQKRCTCSATTASEPCNADLEAEIGSDSNKKKELNRTARERQEAIPRQAETE